MSRSCSFIFHLNRSLCQSFLLYLNLKVWSSSYYEVWHWGTIHVIHLVRSMLYSSFSAPSFSSKIEKAITCSTLTSFQAASLMNSQFVFIYEDASKPSIAPWTAEQVLRPTDWNQSWLRILWFLFSSNSSCTSAPMMPASPPQQKTSGTCLRHEVFLFSKVEICEVPC